MRYIKSFANDAAIQAAVDNKTLGKPYVALNDATGKIDWNGKEETPDYSKIPLTLNILNSGIIKFSRSNSRAPIVSVQYKINDDEWQMFTSSSLVEIQVSSGDKLQLKGNNNAYGTSGDNFNTFSGTTATFTISGNILSLVDADNFAVLTQLTNDNTFPSLFRNCTGLTDASNLVLQATTLSNDCYMSMFRECTNLTAVPELPAGVLTELCYHYLFFGCSSLNYIKCLATDISASNCVYSWVYGVAPTGTFVKKAGVTWPTGNNGIPRGWTVIEE